MAPIIPSEERLIVTRTEAKSAGATRFFPRLPCRHGHVADRLVSSGACTACKAARNAADAAKVRPPNTAPKRCSICGEEKPRTEFYAQRTNPDGLRSRCKACKKEEAAKYYSADPVPRRAATTRYRELHPDKAHASMIAWQIAYPDRFAAAHAAWYKAHPEANRANQATRRAQKRQSGGKHTAKDIKSLFKLQRGKCAHPWCRASLDAGYHVDHIMPLSRGGSNARRNLQLLCAPCNLSKRDKHPIDFAQSRGMLL